jgi:hypothetical protein
MDQFEQQNCTLELRQHRSFLLFEASMKYTQTHKKTTSQIYVALNLWIFVRQIICDSQ